jgi:hypothetical protein
MSFPLKWTGGDLPKESLKWRGYIIHLFVGLGFAIAICGLVGLLAGMANSSVIASLLMGPTFAIPIFVGFLAGAFATCQSQNETGRWVWVPLIAWAAYGVLESPQFQVAR